MPVTDYRFLVVGSAGTWWLNGRGLRGATETDRDDFRLVVGFDPPSWLADRVFYQVFPDRFENGDAGNDVHDRAWVYRGQPTRRRAWEDRPSDGPGGSVEFFGGDLAGLEARLDHLVDLGVNAIYLNPVFDSRSNHGYDTIDYGHVAAHFGGDEALVSLRRATLARDIRADPRHRAQPHRRRAPLVRRRAGRPVGADRRLLHVPLAARRLRVVAGREVAAQARLPRRRAARGDVRGPGRDPAPLARAAVLGRRLAHRRGQHARAARARSSSGRRSPAGCAPPSRTRTPTRT